MPTGPKGEKRAAVEPRNFECPESGERCVDGRCTTERCCESTRLQVLKNTPHEKFFNRSTYKLAREIVSRLLQKKSD
jgi:hypothetical protein